MQALSVRGLRKSFRALAAMILATGLAPAGAAPTIGERIARAERVEDWRLVEKLSGKFRFAAPSELHVLTAILNACVARKCDERRLIDRLRGPLVSGLVHEFAKAWLESVARDPASARLRFEALARDPGNSWLGLAGRLSYATDTGNVALLREALRDATKDEAARKLLEDDILSAEVALAFMTHDHERIPILLQSPKEIEPWHLLARFGYLLRKDDLDAAAKTLRTYAQLFGDDHDLVGAEIDLAKLRLAPREVVSLLESKLAARPANWRLRLALMPVLIESGDEKRARETLASLRHFPTAFAGVRLQLAAMTAAFGGLSQAQIDKLEQVLKPFSDYPETHIAVAAAYLDAGQAGMSKRHLALADSQNDARSAAIALHADIAKKEGRDAEAARLHERVAALSPKEIGSQFSLAYAYVDAKDFTAARRVIAVIRSSPRYVDRERLEVLEQIVTSGLR